MDCNKNQVPLLKRLPLDQQPLVARAAKSVKFPPRTVIIKEGPVPWCFVSLAPSLQVLVGLTYANSPGDYCKVGELVSEQSIFHLVRAYMGRCYPYPVV